MKFLFPFSFLILFFCAFHADAQKQGQASIDSMLASLPAQRDDTSKVRLLNNLSFTYYGINPAEGLRFGTEGLALARKLGWREGEADARNKIGINYFIQSDFSKALEEQFAARNIYEEIGQQQHIPRVLISIGSIYQRQSEFDKAAEYFNEALRRYTALGDKRGMASGYGSLGNVCRQRGAYTKSLEYQFKALALFEQLPYKDMLAINLNNIGSTYNEQRAYPQALAYFSRAARLANELGYKSYNGEYLVNIGEVYLDIAGDSSAGNQNFSKADSLMPSSRAAALAKAEDYLSRALAVNREVANLNQLQENYQLLSRVALLKGDYKRAYEAFAASQEIRDSVFSMEKSKVITRLETLRALALKDKQIELDRLAVAKKRNERVFFVAGLLLLLGITAVAIRGRRKSDALLLNILPAEIAEELKRKGSSAARQFDAVTVLFTDFVNFTNAGERMSAQQLVSELDTCFKAFDAIIGRHRIEKIKTIGDAYLAVAGLPQADAAHAQHMVHAAIEIMEFIKQRKAAIGEDAFEVRIGIHSGPVVAGIVGVKKFAYDIWGDTVNTAARMEQACEPGRINISETTYELVSTVYSCTFRGEIIAKNKGPLKMYFVEGKS